MRYVDIYNPFERRFNPDNKNLICTQPTEIIKNINIDALGSYLDINKLESICNRARHTAALKTKKSEE